MDYRDEKRSRYQGKRRNNGENKGEGYQKKSYGDREGGYQKKEYSRDGGYQKTSYGDKPYEKREGDYRKKQYGDKPYEKKFEKRDRFDKGEKPFDKREKPVEAEPMQQTGGQDELPFLLIGRNAVREAVKSGRSIDRILVTTEQDGSLREIVNLARDKKLVLREVDRRKLDELCMPFGHGGKTVNHQGIVAYAAGMEYCNISDMLADAKAKGEEPFIIVLDGVEDPHNLGSIIRSAECAGAHGVIIGKRRSASVTAAAVKAAAGATAYMKVARVVNVSGALEELKRAGLWVAGADMSGSPMNKQGLNGALALVIGGEGGGLTKLVRETCDFLVSIPMYGQINSLNASVAAAVLMFEKRRQDNTVEE